MEKELGKSRSETETLDLTKARIIKLTKKNFELVKDFDCDQKGRRGRY